MNYLTALLAFAAIMIVLTTLATVVVEGIHKLMRKRAEDFEHLALQLYENAIRPSLHERSVRGFDGEVKDNEAANFVKQLTRNPAFDATRTGKLEKIPVVKNLFDKSFQELTTRQFVEQFAQTDAGKALQKTGNAVALELIGKFSYEFERYGEAASSYFKRRASVLSVGVAFILAFSLNFDAFKLFDALARDGKLSAQVIASIDVAKIEAAYVARMNEVEAGGGKSSISEEFDSILNEIRTESAELQGLGLPIGLAYFPYCQDDPTGKFEGKDAADPRCNAIPESSDFTVSLPVIGTPVTAIGQFIENVVPRVLSPAGFGWFVAVLISGGMIGLGAPFWFKTYRFVADFVPGARRPDGTLSRQQRSGKAAATKTILPGTPHAKMSDHVNPDPALTSGTESPKSGDDSSAQVEPSDPPPSLGTRGLEFISDLGLSDDELFRAFSQTRPVSKSK